LEASEPLHTVLPPAAHDAAAHDAAAHDAAAHAAAAHAAAAHAAAANARNHGPAHGGSHAGGHATSHGRSLGPRAVQPFQVAAVVANHAPEIRSDGRLVAEVVRKRHRECGIPPCGLQDLINNICTPPAAGAIAGVTVCVSASTSGSATIPTSASTTISAIAAVTAVTTASVAATPVAGRREK